MTKKFVATTVLAIIIGIIAGFFILNRNQFQGPVKNIPAKVWQMIFHFGIERVHANAANEKDSSCQSSGCHRSMTTEAAPWHKMHLTAAETNFKCADCHKKVTTGPRTLKGKVNVDRSICLKCHLQKFPGYILKHQRSDWIKLHKILPSVQKLKPKCFMCHNPQRKELNFCNQCHKFHEHSKSWIFGGHGEKAIKTDFSCLRCHEKKAWCTWRCHQGVTLPHNIPKWTKHWQNEPNAPKWRKIHFRMAAKLGLSVCQRCHKFQGAGTEFCQQCHHKKFYKAMPGLGTPWATKQGGMAYVKANGSEECWKCHDAQFCAFCHTYSQKPPFVNFTRQIKSSVLLLKIPQTVFVENRPNYYNYYNYNITIENLFPEFDENGFFKKNITR